MPQLAKRDVSSDSNLCVYKDDHSRPTGRRYSLSSCDQPRMNLNSLLQRINYKMRWHMPILLRVRQLNEFIPSKFSRLSKKSLLETANFAELKTCDFNNVCMRYYNICRQSDSTHRPTSFRLWVWNTGLYKRDQNV